jgi:hypothetical protein
MLQALLNSSGVLSAELLRRHQHLETRCWLKREM